MCNPEDKQKCELPRAPSFSLHPEILSEEEATQMDQFGQAAGALIHRWVPPPSAVSSPSEAPGPRGAAGIETLLPYIPCRLLRHGAWPARFCSPCTLRLSLMVL